MAITSILCSLKLKYINMHKVPMLHMLFCLLQIARTSHIILNYYMNFKNIINASYITSKPFYTSHMATSTTFSMSKCTKWMPRTKDNNNKSYTLHVGRYKENIRALLRKDKEGPYNMTEQTSSLQMVTFKCLYLVIKFSFSQQKTVSRIILKKCIRL